MCIRDRVRSRRRTGENSAGLNSSKTVTPTFESERANPGYEADPYQLEKRRAFPKKNLPATVTHSHKELRDWASNPSRGASERDDSAAMMISGFAQRSANCIGGGWPSRTSSGMPAPRVRPSSKKAVTVFKRDKPKGLDLQNNRQNQLMNEQGIGSAGVREFSDQLSTLRRHDSAAQLRAKEDSAVRLALAP